MLGAGLSIPRGIPSWPRLVERAWRRTFGATPDWLAGDAPSPHPLALQLAFEQVDAALRSSRARKAPELADLLRDCLYESERAPKRGEPADTLAAVAALLRQEQRAPSPRVVRVISFNADDLLEREVHQRGRGRSRPVVWPIPRASNHPRRHGAGDRPPIPLYHPHGYLPRARETAWHRDAPDTLVFTDAQYWASVAQPSSFANRVMATALHDSHCIFVGLSMTDVNLMRWLGVRALEILDDKHSQFRARPVRNDDALRRSQQNALQRHWWVRAGEVDSGTELIRHWLDSRGVRTVTLPSWGAPFADLLARCFPAARTRGKVSG